MSTIIFQGWTRIGLGDSVGDLRFWSNEVIAKGDPRNPKNYGRGSLNWLGKAFFWRRRVILVPSGSLPETRFVVIFRDEDGYMACSRERRVDEGPFMMRVGPRDIRFFLLGNYGNIGLSIAGYVRGSMRLY